MTTSKNPGYIALWQGGQPVADSIGDVIVYPTYQDAMKAAPGVEKVHRLVRWAKPQKKKA